MHYLRYETGLLFEHIYLSLEKPQIDFHYAVDYRQFLC